MTIPLFHVDAFTDRPFAGNPAAVCILPSGQPHGLKNDGNVTLRYFSAAAPAYEAGHLEKTWALKSEAEDKDE